MKLRTMLLAGAAATTMISSGAAIAQAAAAPPTDQTASGGIAQVVVTARKRSENLQRVPVAVTAMSAAQLKQHSIFQPSDLTAYVPSLQIIGNNASEPGAAVIVLRGQTAGSYTINEAQAVGFNLDGVSLPHPAGTNSSFYDLSSVEVLKGPQGTLYGRNTTGGALNITTRDADFNGTHGFLELEGGSYDDAKVTGAVNLVAIPDVLSFRLAGQYWYRNGYTRSILTNQTFGGEHNDKDVRLTTRFTPAPKVSADLVFEYVNYAQTDAPLTWRDYKNGGSPLTDTSSPINPLNPGFGVLGQGEIALEGVSPALVTACLNNKNFFLNCSPVNQYDHFTSYHGGLTVTYDLTDSVRLKSITGYHQLTEFQQTDPLSVPYVVNAVGYGVGGLAFPPSPLGPFAPPTAGMTPPIPNSPTQQSESFSQEFDFSGSAFDKRLDWLVGLYGDADTAYGAQHAGIFPLVTGGITVPGDINPQYTESLAVFSQENLHLTDQLSLTMGGRYTTQTVKATVSSYGYNFMVPASPTPFGCAGGPNGQQLFGVSVTPQATAALCGQTGKRTFDGDTYLLSLNYQITPDVLTYIKTSRGWKAGGEEDATAGFVAPPGVTPGLPFFKPESVVDYEFGFKGDFFEHRLRTDLAIYRSNYDNKQVSEIINLPAGGNAVGVANAQAVIQGVEFEATAIPVDHWSLYGNFTYFDGYYTSFPGAILPAGATCPAARLQTNGGCNESGTSFPNPKWNYNIGSRYDIQDVGPGILSVQGDWSWYAASPLNFTNIQPFNSLALQKYFAQARGLLNARVEYNMNNGLMFAAFATNLLNTHYQSAGTPLLGYLSALTQPPIEWGIQIRKTFGGG